MVSILYVDLISCRYLVYCTIVASATRTCARMLDIPRLVPPPPPPPPTPEGGYSHIWAIRVCAAQQGMFFASLTLEQGIKIALFLWNRVYFTSGLTLE